MENKFFLAENIAKRFKICREDQDTLAAQSQQRAEAAIAAGYFKKEIVTVEVPGRKQSTFVSQDEYPKAGTTAENLGKLRPVFDKVCKE